MTIRREEKQGLYCLAWSAQKRFNLIKKKLVNVILILILKGKAGKNDSEKVGHCD